MKKQRFRRYGKGGGACIFGALISIATLFCVSAIGALILSNLKNPIDLLGGFALGALILSAVIASVIVSKRYKDSGFGTPLFSSLISSAVILATGLIGGGGKLTLGILMNVLCYVLVFLAFSKLCTRKPGRRRH